VDSAATAAGDRANEDAGLQPVLGCRDRGDY